MNIEEVRVVSKSVDSKVKVSGVNSACDFICE